MTPAVSGLLLPRRELHYDRLPVGALQGLDPGRVAHGGTVSKVLSPALRLGWIAAPPRLTEEIIAAKFLDDFAAEALGQLTLARFISSGGFARHLRRVRPVYRARRDRLLETVAETAARHGIQLEEAAVHWADRRGFGVLSRGGFSHSETAAGQRSGPAALPEDRGPDSCGRCPF